MKMIKLTSLTQFIFPIYYDVIYMVKKGEKSP